MKKYFENFWLLFSPWIKYAKLFTILSSINYCVIIPFAEYLAVIIPEKVLNELTKGSAYNQIFLVALEYAGAALILTVLSRIIIDYYGIWKINDVTKHIESDIVNCALEVPQEDFDNPDYFDSYKLVTEEFSKKSTEMFEHTFKLLNSVIQIILFSVLITIKGSYIILIILLFSLCATFSQIYWSKVSTRKNLSNLRNRRIADYVRRLFFDPGIVQDLKVSQLDWKIKSMLIFGYDNISNNNKKYAGSEFIIDMLISLANLGINFVVPLYIAKNVIANETISVSIFSTLLIASNSLKTKLNEFGWWSSQLTLESNYAAQVAKFFAYKKSEDGDITLVQNEKLSITVTDLVFLYKKSNFELHIQELNINPGERIAIVGENGVGKSTLTKLILNLYQPQSGVIKINDVPIDKYEKDSLFNSISYVPQKPLIYAMTVKDYIDCDDHDTDVNGVKEILDKFNMHINFDDLLTKEFDENGVILSEGQKQLLCLSRIFKKNYGLIILDEPSSALDPITEEKMVKLIENNIKTTLIVIAHRLSTIKNMDRIIVMDNGRIVESGTHQQLLEKQGKYFKMYNKQAERYK